MKRRRIEITAVEQERIVAHAVQASCPICRTHTEFLTPAEAALMAHVEIGLIHRWMVEEKLHGATTPDGQSRICRNSLLRFGSDNRVEPGRELTKQ